MSKKQEEEEFQRQLKEFKEKQKREANKPFRIGTVRDKDNTIIGHVIHFAPWANPEDYVEIIGEEEEDEAPERETDSGTGEGYTQRVPEQGTVDSGVVDSIQGSPIDNPQDSVGEDMEVAGSAPTPPPLDEVRMVGEQE